MLGGKMEKEKIKETEELKNLLEAAKKYRDAHDGNVSMILDVCAFDEKDNNVIDDRTFICGTKDVLLTQHKTLKSIIKKLEE